MSAFSALSSTLRGLDANGKYLMISSVLLNWGGGYFLVARPVYMYAIQLDPTTVGELISLQAFLAIALSVPIAMASDTLGRKRFVVLGLLLDGVASFLFFYSPNIIVLVAAQVLFAGVNAAAGSPFLALFTGSTTNENRNEAFVLLGFAGGISTALGGYASGLPIYLGNLFNIGYLGGFRLLFLAVSFSSLAGGIVVARFVSETGVRRAPGGKLSLRGMMKFPTKSMGVVKKFSVIGFTGFGAGLIIPLLSLWFTLRYAVDISVIGPLFGSIFLLIALASLFTPAIARRRGEVFTIVVSQLSAIAILVAIPLSPNYLDAGVLMVLRSTLSNMAGPITNSFAMGLVDPEERATATSVIQLFDAVPRAYSPTLTGYLFSLGMIDLPFYITAVLYLVSSSLFYLFFRNTKLRGSGGPGAAGSGVTLPPST